MCIQQNKATCTPQFGRIKKLFAHSFAQHDIIFAEVYIFVDAHRDEELGMWFVPAITITSTLLTLKEISEPLVVANDVEFSLIWLI